jgi:hypothetical protein
MQPDRPQSPSRYDSVTIPCPVCDQPFTPTGKRQYCSDRCRVTSWRRRRSQPPSQPAVPPGRPRRPVTVYECPSCEQRALGVQRCDDCGTFMRRIGVGGLCPNCDEPIALQDILDLPNP